MHRRQILSSALAGVVLLNTPLPCSSAQAPNARDGRLKQSVARWCFASYGIEELCEQLQDMGVSGMDLVGPTEWDTCKRYGITPCMVQGAGSLLPAQAGSKWRWGGSVGWNQLENHAQLIATARDNIALAAKAGLRNVIGLFGDRKDMSDAQGIANCVTGLRQIVPLLEASNIVLGLELLNSKVDHPDYQGDHTLFGVEVCRQLGSPNVKLLFDAYHMQIMEGDLISTIRSNIQWISHFHIAGVPGRNDIDEHQEVNWRAVGMAIADLGFTGYVAHEWLPAGNDPLEELRKAVALMTM